MSLVSHPRKKKKFDWQWRPRRRKIEFLEALRVSRVGKVRFSHDAVPL